MSAETEEIRKAVISILEGKIPLISSWCTVKAINGTVCDVILDGDEDLLIPDVLLGFDKSGMVIKPQVNTDVLVLFIDNTKTNGAVVMVEQTDTIELMGNEFDGLPKVNSVVEKMNNLENDLNTLKNALGTLLATPVNEPGNGSPSAFQIAMKTALLNYNGQQFVNTVKADLENEKVLHGKG